MKTSILHPCKRILASLLCLVLLASFLLAVPPVRSEAKNYGQYKDVAKIYDQGSCPSMQGMSICGNYIYACKINNNTEKDAVVARVHKDTQEVKFLTNSATGTKYFSDFGHGNDIEVENINGVLNLFVPTSTSGSGSLVRYQISGTTATKLGSYTMTNNGSNISGGAIRVTHYDDTSITFLFKSGKVCYTGTLPISQTSGTLEMTKLCTLDYSTAYVNGVAKDTSAYSLQGMGYYDYKLFLPLSGHTVSGHLNISIILVYDMEGASGTIKPDPDLTFCITSSQYAGLFELESCEISPKDGRMYFSANRRVSSSDTNHDGVSYISNWTYDPAARSGGAQNYRWELKNDELVSTTNGGNVYNGIHQMEGSIKNGTITNGRFVLSKPIVLEHSRPWILEWKSTGAGSGSLLFATAAESSVADKPYVFRRTGSSLVSIGAYDGSSYNNYGLELSDYGIDGTVEHVYRMTNKINSDGSNMVYLSVDGEELGPLNGHYIAEKYQNVTSNWVSGKDLSFSYLGTLSHKINNCKIDYVQVWSDGLASVSDEPNNFRWEGNMGSVTSTYNLSENTATLVSGSSSNTTYTDCRYNLQKPVVLMHNRPWEIEWKSYGAWTGSSLLLAADHMSNTYGAPYLFQGGSVIALGYHNGKQHEQWGVQPADYGISLTDYHTYSLKNEVSTDGGNTIYLYIDGNKIAPMDTYCVGGSVSTNTTTDSLRGKDIVFSHMGTYQHDINAQIEYLQVWENGKPEDHQPNNYRWETQNNTLVNVVSANLDENPSLYIKGSCVDGVYNDSQFMLSKPVVLRHDRPWKVEWQCEGAWTGGGLLMSANRIGNTKNNLYLFRNGKTISIGLHTGSRYEQWGVLPADYGIDHSKLHTYTLNNKVAADGSNMVYLSVDGQELAPMITTCIGGTPDGTTSNWISGKDFMFSYLGSQQHSLTSTTMTYLQVSEGCNHRYSNWTETETPTCNDNGTQARTCELCGETETKIVASMGHDYQTKVTVPTCTDRGYTIYTCSNCGDQYIDDYTSTIGHDYKATVVAPTCNSNGYTTYKCSTCGDSYQSDPTEAAGHNYLSSVTAPTCTAQGFTTYTCSVCGDSYKGNYTEAKGHKYDTVVTEPTCEGFGYSTNTCSVCGHSFRDSIQNPIGHNYETVITAPTCTENGYTSYTCHCGSSYVDHETAALGHKYETVTVDATCTADGSVTETCSVCGDTKTQVIPAKGHSFANGTCTVCGTADPDYVAPIVQPTLKLKAPALEFKDMIKVIAFYEATNLENVVEMGMITYTENVEVVDITTAAHVIPGAEYDEATGRYFASSQGIHAKYLCDDVYLAIYAKLTDGSYVYTRLVSYGAVTYATNQLKNSTDMKLKQLVAAMLNYGAAAQNYFGHNTENLANATLTEEQKLLPEAYSADMISAVPSVAKEKQGEFASNKGFGTRKPAVSFEGAFSINYFFTPKYAPVDGITLYYWTEADFNAVDVLTVENASGSVMMEGEGTSQYRGDVVGIAAKNLTEAVYVAAVYSDGTSTWTSGVLGYSIGAYCSGQAANGGTMGDLAMTTAVYGYHAKQYFSQII